MKTLHCYRCNKSTNHYPQESYIAENGVYDLADLSKVIYFICSECNQQHQSFESISTPKINVDTFGEE